MSMHPHKVTLHTILLCLTLGISIFLHTFQINDPCLNEDEVAHGYNTYSVLQTGYDEYGRIPLRFLSFGENKLPLAGILSAPFISIGGLNNITVRIPSLIIGIIFPLLFYGVAFTLFQSRRIGLIAAFLASTNVWLNTISRHEHEAVILAAIVLVFIATLYRSFHFNKRTMIRLGILYFMGLYAYHTAKIVMPFLGICALVLIWKRDRKNFAWMGTILLSASIIFGITEIIQPNNRVANLSYFTAPVFSYEIEEGRRNRGSPMYYNKVVYGTSRFIQRSIGYLSPKFLVETGDPNPRFGSPNVHLLTIVEYVAFLFGFLFIWLAKYRHRLFLTMCIGITIVPSVAALPIDSSTRSYLLIIPLIVIASVGIDHLLHVGSSLVDIKKWIMVSILILALIMHVISLTTSWQYYFQTYLRDPSTLRAWQCGAKEMSQYVWKSYDKFDRFIITREYGQPYIFLLFHKPVPPANYQKVSKPGLYNEYGFWEQDGFDKFEFRKPNSLSSIPRTSYILSPTEVKTQKLDVSTLIPLSYHNVVMYYVKENIK